MSEVRPHSYTAKDGWQPIDTAPKDGTHILLYRSNEHCSISEAFWRQDVFKIAYEWGGHGWSYPKEDQPTHWMPMPSSPTATSGCTEDKR